MDVKKIILENINKKKQIIHEIQRFHKQIIFLQWHHIIEIIQLYQPTADLNKVLIQVKVYNSWQYITTNFSYSLIHVTNQPLHIRYRIYEQQKIDESQLQDIEENLAECGKKIDEYKKKFDINSMDINLFWASPLYRSAVNLQKQVNIDNNLIDWSIGSQNYINQIGQTLKKSKKRVYLTINSLNSNCFKLRNEYSMVYLICHTQNQQTRKQKPKMGELNKKNYTQQKKQQIVFQDKTRYYLAGQKNNGQLEKIYPQNLYQILKNKKIQLLILHTSYHFMHLNQILRCENIHNVLVIKSNPIYSSKSTSYFIKLFFTYLINGQSIVDAHAKSLNQVITLFPNDEMCCCYHQSHDRSCKGRVKSTNRFFGYHYRFHSIEKKQNECCCQSLLKPNFDYATNHNLSIKFQLKILKHDSIKNFQFQKGQLQGEYPYLKGFCYQKGLIGNRYLFIQLLKTFNRHENTKKINNTYKIFNIYNRICGDKRIFVLTVSNFLIRRKIIKQNRIYEAKFLDQIQFEEKNPDVLYTIFCNVISPATIKKLQSLSVNMLIVSKYNLHIKDFNPLNGSKAIDPLNMKQCQNYIKVQKHLTKIMKQKVNQFFINTWKQKYCFMYYPSNFDYKALMSMIAKNGIDSSPQSRKQFKPYDQLFEKLQGKLFRDFIFVMSIYANSSPQQRIKFKYRIIQLQFYKKLVIINQQIQKGQQIIKMQLFFTNSLRYLQLILQRNVKKMQQNIIKIIKMFIKYTFIFKLQQSWIYEATTVNAGSLVSMLFKKNIKQCNQLKINEQILKLVLECNQQTILRAGLKLVQNIVTCFYLYEALQVKQQMLRNQQHIQGSQQNQVDENEWQQKIQYDRKSKILILSLILINNAIIHRKNTTITLEIQKNSQDQEIVFEQNNKQSGDIFNQQMEKDVQQSGIQEDSIIQNQMQENSQDDNEKVYGQEDLIIQINCLARYGLLYILSKIREKKPKIKILAVTDALALQLLLQTIYQSNNVNENNFKILLNELRDIFNGWGLKYTYGRFRIAYDMLICLILIDTKCGQQKLSKQSSDKIDDYFKQLLYKERNERQLKSQQNHNELYQIVQKLCPNLQSFIIIRQHIRQCQSRLKKKYRQEKYLNGYVQLIQLHQKFNQCTINIRGYNKINESYIIIFEMKLFLKKLGYQQRYQQQVIMFYMLNALCNKLDGFLKQIKNRLMMILTTNYFGRQMSSNYMINFKNVLKKCKIRGYIEDEESQMEQKKEQQALNNDLIVVIMEFKKKNIDLLLKNQGYKYLIINANNQQDILKVFFQKEDQILQEKKQEIKKKQRKDKLKEKDKHKGERAKTQEIQKKNENIQKLQQISDKILKIGHQYIFLSYSKHQELQKNLIEYSNIKEKIQSQISNQKVNKCNIISLGVKLLKDLDQEQKNLVMLTISIKIAQNIHKNTDNFEVKDLIQKIRNTMQLKYRQNTLHKNKIVKLSKIQYKFDGKVLFSQKQSIMKQQERVIHIQLQQTQVIKKNYLELINKIMEIQPIEQMEQLKKVQKKAQPQINLHTFVQNFSFYLAEMFQIQLFFNFSDDESFASHRSPKDKGEEKIMPETKLVNSLMDDQFLSAFHSRQKMGVIIKWFEYVRDNSWLKEVLRSIFFNSQNKQFKNRYINIDGIHCLICIRVVDQKR